MLSIAIAAFKIRDILIYFSVPFILCIVYRLISSFTIYKAFFALITVSIIRGVVLIVKKIVLLINIK